MAWCSHCKADRPIQRQILSGACSYCDASPQQNHHHRCRGPVPGALDVCTFCNSTLFCLATNEDEFNQYSAAETDRCRKCGSVMSLVTFARGNGVCATCKNKGCQRGCLGVVLAFLFIFIMGVLTSKKQPEYQRIDPSPKPRKMISNRKNESKINPRPLRQKLVSLGLRTATPWHEEPAKPNPKDPFNNDPYWFSKSRCFIKPNGQKSVILPEVDDNPRNELICQLLGTTKDSVSTIKFGVKIVDPTSEPRALELCAELIEHCFNNCPAKVREAILAGSNVVVDEWKVQKRNSDEGYETLITHIPKPENAE